MATKFKKYSEIEGIRDIIIFIILGLLFYHFELWKDVSTIFDKITAIIS